MGATNLRRRPDDQHQPLRHDVLFSRRPARVARRHGTDRPVDHPGLRVARIRQTGTRGARPRLRHVLALCGCDMGSGSSSGLRDRPVGGFDDGGTRPPLPAVEEPEGTVVALPAPTAWPFVVALGVALIFAGFLAGAAVSMLGAMLYVAG